MKSAKLVLCWSTVLAILPACGAAPSGAPSAPGRWLRTHTTSESAPLTAVAVDAPGARYVVAGRAGTALVGGNGRWRSVFLGTLLAPYEALRGDFEEAWAEGGRLFVAGGLGFYTGGVIEVGGASPRLALADPPLAAGPAVRPFGGPVHALTGRPGEIWAIGTSRSFRFDGEAWSPIDWRVPDANAWMAPDGTFWSAGRAIHERSAEGWTRHWDAPAGGYVRRLSGSADGTLVGVGEITLKDGGYLPLVVRYNGASWITETAGQLPAGTGRLHGVWGSDAQNIYAVGEAGVILHYDGIRWELERLADAGDFLDVVGLGPDELVIVGTSGIHERR